VIPGGYPTGIYQVSWERKQHEAFWENGMLIGVGVLFSKMPLRKGAIWGVFK